MIRIMRCGALGEAAARCGRSLIADSLNAQARAAAGDPYASSWLTGAAAFPVPTVAMACLWFREQAQSLGLGLRLDILDIGPQNRADMGVDQYRAWEDAHHYLAGMPPYAESAVSERLTSEGTAVCCQKCLLRLACALAGTCGFLLAQYFSGEWSIAETYVRRGGEVPPSFAPAAADPDAVR